MNELKLVRKLYSYLQGTLMKINKNTVDQLIDDKKDDSIITFERPLTFEDVEKYLLEKSKKLLEEELKFDEQVCIDISKLVHNAFFENNFGKYKNEYIFFHSDETEAELYLSEDAKKLYKYGVENDKPWTIFVEEVADMQDIDDAMWLLLTM
jgi:hypothetical protein